MWWRGKRGARWAEERDADFWRNMTARRLRELRAIVAKAYHARGGNAAERSIGFVPRTFAVWALEKAGVDLRAELGTGADLIIRSYALYQTLQIASGSWEEGPRDWKRLPPVYKDNEEDTPRRS